MDRLAPGRDASTSATPGPASRGRSYAAPTCTLPTDAHDARLSVCQVNPIDLGPDYGRQAASERGDAAWRPGAAGHWRRGLQVLCPPGCEPLILDEVVVHCRLSVVTEVQHAWLVMQEAARVIEQCLERNKA